jgi:hypothetical protein
MWVFAKSRDEHDHRALVNLDRGTRINVTVLGERWFVDVMQGSDIVSIAQVSSEDEAKEIFQRIFDGLASGRSAIDLDRPRKDDEGSVRPAKSEENRE